MWQIASGDLEDKLLSCMQERSAIQVLQTAGLGSRVLRAQRFSVAVRKSMSSLMATALSVELSILQTSADERPELAMLFLKSDIATGMDLWQNGKRTNPTIKEQQWKAVRGGKYSRVGWCAYARQLTQSQHCTKTQRYGLGEAAAILQVIVKKCLQWLYQEMPVGAGALTGASRQNPSG